MQQYMLSPPTLQGKLEYMMQMIFHSMVNFRDLTFITGGGGLKVGQSTKRNWLQKGDVQKIMWQLANSSIMNVQKLLRFVGFTKIL